MVLPLELIITPRLFLSSNQHGRTGLTSLNET